MATINLGNIKFNWKGTYNAGTAYAVDDVVSYNGSSYVCIQATTGNLPTVTAYWDTMSQKGTDADLLNIASTAQGDIYYNNGSAIARLGAGTSGQFLKTQGTGANPTWGNVTSSILQMKSVQFGDTFSTTTQTFTGTSATEYTPATLTITPTSATSLIIADYTFQCNHNGDYMGLYYLTYNHSGISETSIEHDDQYGSTRAFDRSTNTSSDGGYGISGRIIIDPQTTNAVTVKHRWATTNSSHATYINTCESPTANDPYKGIGSVILTEVAGSIITHTKGNNINGD